MVTNAEHATPTGAEETPSATPARPARREAALLTLIAVPQLAWLVLLCYLAYRIAV